MAAHHSIACHYHRRETALWCLSSLLCRCVHPSPTTRCRTCSCSALPCSCSCSACATPRVVSASLLLQLTFDGLLVLSLATDIHHPLHAHVSCIMCHVSCTMCIALTLHYILLLILYRLPIVAAAVTIRSDCNSNHYITHVACCAVLWYGAVWCESAL